MPTEPEAHGAEATSADPAAEPQVGYGGAPPVAPARSAGEATPPSGDGQGDGDGGPGGPAPGQPSVGWFRRRVLVWTAAVLALAFLVGAAAVPLPYYLFKPGSVRDTEQLISVKGARTYPSRGAIGYTTVSLGQARLFGLVQAWFDDDIAVLGRDEVLQGHNVKQNQRINLQMMVSSKQVATQVALERLGYDVNVTYGQLVDQVVKGTAADGVLKPNDVIVAVDGHRFHQIDDLTKALADKQPGDRVIVTVRPAGGQAEAKHELTLGPSPDDPSKGVMGVRIVPIAIDYHFPFAIAIDTGNVGGPSAGLAFTLGIIDDLTPGSLTGGHDVAVTGTIAPDGTVGPIGGAGQKAAAVRREGIRLFLVPRDDYKDAQAHAGKGLKVVAVDNLDDALAVLAKQGGNADHLPQVGRADAKAA